MIFINTSTTRTPAVPLILYACTKAGPKSDFQEVINYRRNCNLNKYLKIQLDMYIYVKQHVGFNIIKQALLMTRAKKNLFTVLKDGKKLIVK